MTNSLLSSAKSASVAASQRASLSRLGANIGRPALFGHAGDDIEHGPLDTPVVDLAPGSGKCLLGSGTPCSSSTRATW